MSVSDAYVAGLIDGEGCVYITDAKRHASQSFSIRCEVGMTGKAWRVLKLLKERFSGKIHRGREATDDWDAAYRWKIQGQECASMLRAILPHLRLKKRQAELALSAEGIRQSLIPNGGSNARWTQESSTQCALIQKQIQELNRKGPSGQIEDVTPRDMGAVPTAHLVGGSWMTFQKNLLNPTGWEPYSGTFPNSGIVAHGVFWTRNTSEWPKDADVCSLSDILETGDVPPKYFLSPKACRGILRRAAKRGRELPPALHEALTAVAAEDTPGEDEKMTLTS